MRSRREFLQFVAASAGVFSAYPSFSAAAARQQLSQDDLLSFDAKGQVTLLHLTDIHGQLKPVYFRPPSENFGVANFEGIPPHLVGQDFLRHFGIAPGSALAYAHTMVNYESLARAYGRLGGLDRTATLVKAIRAERGDDSVLLLDGGDTWQGSLTALRSNGGDMVRAMNALGVDAMTSHWEFTLGIDRVTEIVENELNFPFLGANIFDAMWDEPAYEPYRMFEQNGVNIGVIGQAFPYMPIANPGWMFPDLSFGIREERVAEMVEEVRAAGADVVVLLSHNGFDVDRKLAGRVPGIDVILTGHTHDALPEPVIVNNTLVIATGSHGKFVSRLDLDVRDGAVQGYGYRLIPIFSDVIAADPAMTALVDAERAPYEAELGEVLGHTANTLYRRGNFNGTWDDLLCQAMLEERDADIALSPGFRWGSSVPAGQAITREELFNATSMSYPNCYRTEMTGELLHTIMEDVADNLFNTDPYYQQGGDMVRVGGMGYRIDISQPQGSRISEMTLLRTGELIDPAASYTVAGWASVNEGTEGPPIWDVAEAYIRRMGTVDIPPNQSVIVTGE